MFMRKITVVCLVCAVFIPVAGVPSFANSSIEVSLWDMGQDMDLSKNSGRGSGMHRDMAAAKLGIKLTRKACRQERSLSRWSTIPKKCCTR